ncbi:FXYD domain containing ion transport regulator 7 isoform X4 [Alosa alosa]|uniref:FXYD domain-containing ion transport regulator 6-like isoform X3 n=1 Tax=Alosa sapidissima TaxID=34773 RepID=UPI001C08925E|nr:FXYD domain-containing ion transport regulator 6-like isoform X3 [Alosa sapidissima]XP_048117955.1 FXYD domain containing ion transport regulator 7 isoform X4 [Alosa alosa]
MDAAAESNFPDQSAFHYDYATLQTTGVILGVAMFLSGIIIALSKKTQMREILQPCGRNPGTQDRSASSDGVREDVSVSSVGRCSNS